jgi:hypothetical protein
MIKLQYPDYENCSVNLACSILKYFGAEGTGNPSLALADEFLSKPYKNVVLLILDGMGLNVLEHNLKPDGFFRTHLKGTYSSVFPPTTVAATVALDTGLYPAQTGWLGWSCYFGEIDKNVAVFRNTDESGQPAADYDVAWKYRPYTGMMDRLRAAGYESRKIAQFFEPYPKTFTDICNVMAELCRKDGRKYICGYWHEPDAIMHYTGAYSPKAKKRLAELESQVEAFANELEDTIFIITADHGHINCRGAAIADYPELLACLKRMPSIEPRAVNFFVKEGLEETFEKEFKKNFGDDFLLLTKEEVLEQQLFGPGKEHEHFREMLGEYLAVGITDKAIFNKTEDKERFFSTHAGLTSNEMDVPLIVVEK